MAWFIRNSNTTRILQGERLSVRKAETPRINIRKAAEAQAAAHDASLMAMGGSPLTKWDYEAQVNANLQRAAAVHHATNPPETARVQRAFEHNVSGTAALKPAKKQAKKPDDDNRWHVGGLHQMFDHWYDAGENINADTPLAKAYRFWRANGMNMKALTRAADKYGLTLF